MSKVKLKKDKLISNKNVSCNFQESFCKERDDAADKIMEFVYDNPGVPLAFIANLVNIEPAIVTVAIAYLSDFDYIYVDKNNLVRLKELRSGGNPFGFRHATENSDIV